MVQYRMLGKKPYWLTGNIFSYNILINIPYCPTATIWGDNNVVQCSAVQCSAVQCSAVQCSAVQCSAGRVKHIAFDLQTPAQ
jgi:hypothetical protein